MRVTPRLLWNLATLWRGPTEIRAQPPPDATPAIGRTVREDATVESARRVSADADRAAEC